MKLRHACAGDAAAIAAIHSAAFPTDAEARLVADLAGDGDVLVSSVAVDGEGIVGHILFSRMAVEGDGAAFAAAGLAPMAVRPERQRQGIGSALIRGGLEQLSALGVDICFVLGSTDYYPRFGFTLAAARPFASPYAGEHFMARWLRPRSAPRAGRADYAPAFARLG